MDNNLLDNSTAIESNVEQGTTAVVQVPPSITDILIKKPKKILHFSDGTLEEFSDDDETDGKEVPDPIYSVNESELEWGPWLVHKAIKSSYTLLAACDYVGEGIASFLGITTPKYQYEIDEFKRIQAAEANAKKMEGQELTDWVAEAKKLEVNNGVSADDVITATNNVLLKY